jgi:YHS domain-containing protein
MHMKKLLLLLALGFALPVLAQSKTLVNLDKSGVAIQGYDPVAFFTDNKPVKGSAEFQSTYHGGIYYFATAEHKASFEANPQKYEPAFGGFCAFGVAKNHLASVDVDAFQIVNGRLLMQHAPNVRNAFNKNQKTNLATADTNWPALLEQKGK